MSRTDRSYYAGGKKGSLDGVPIWRPKWYGELGNDAEYRDAIKPRGFKASYYDGGHRLTIGGVPIRLAGHVKDWPARAKRALGKGSETYKEARAIEEQWAQMCPTFVPAHLEGSASCVAHHNDYNAKFSGEYGGCWECEREQRQARFEAEQAELREEAA
jgi:hypothetical protein